MIACISKWPLWLMTIALFAGQPNAICQPDSNYAPDILLIDLDVDISAENLRAFDAFGINFLDSLNYFYGAEEIIKIFPRPLNPANEEVWSNMEMWKYYEIIFQDSVNIDSAIIDYSSNEHVLNVMPSEYGFPLQHYPVDKDFLDQWGLHNDYDRDVDAPEAWDFDTSSIPIVIALLDSGVDTLHEELHDNLWINGPEAAPGGPDNIDNDGNGRIDDIHGWNVFSESNDIDPIWTHCVSESVYNDIVHGTMVAGVIAASQDNSVSYYYNIVGINWICQIMIVKCCNDDGYYRSPADLAAGIGYAAETGADIINISVAFGANYYGLKNAVDYAEALGCLIIAGAHNNPSLPTPYPARYENVVSVGRFNEDGCSTQHSSLDTTGVIAPGFNILTTSSEICIPGGDCYGDSHLYVSGTSFATPLVTGIAALAEAKRFHLFGEYLTNEKLREILWNTAEDEICASDPPGYDIVYGRGRSNALRAVFAVARGDVNHDYLANISDAVYLLN